MQTSVMCTNKTCYMLLQQPCSVRLFTPFFLLPTSVYCMPPVLEYKWTHLRKYWLEKSANVNIWSFLFVTKTTRWLQVGLDIADTHQHVSGSGQWCSTTCMWCWVLSWAKNLLWGNLCCRCLRVITRHQLISISEDEASLHKSKMISLFTFTHIHIYAR